MTWHPIFTRACCVLFDRLHSPLYRWHLSHRLYFWLGQRAWWDEERRAGRVPA